MALRFRVFASNSVMKHVGVCTVGLVLSGIRFMSLLFTVQSLLMILSVTTSIGCVIS